MGERSFPIGCVFEFHIYGNINHTCIVTGYDIEPSIDTKHWGSLNQLIKPLMVEKPRVIAYTGGGEVDIGHIPMYAKIIRQLSIEEMLTHDNERLRSYASAQNAKQV